MVNGEPCLACAKLIHQAGIARVIFIRGVYSSSEGVEYLRRYIPAHDVDLDDISTLEAVLRPRAHTVYTCDGHLRWDQWVYYQTGLEVKTT